MIGLRVFHKTFGDGLITSKDQSHITIDFGGDKRIFGYPDAFEKFLVSADQELMAQVNSDLRAKQESRAKTVLPAPHVLTELPKSRKVKKHKKVQRLNVAFKCNFCDGGKTPACIGFNGVCSDSVLRYNINKAHHVWCSSADSPCRSYLDGEISRDELEDMMHGSDGLGYVCYESHMLRDWKASAGIIEKGADKGKPKRLMQVQRNSLAVLTTRDPNYNTDESRYVFAVFLVDESYEGDHREEGYVTTRSDWRISLTPQEARRIRFWNYYINRNAPEKIGIGSGLFRYLSDNQAAQILRDIAEVRTDPRDKDFARRFFEHFCRINGLDPEQVPPPAGALAQKHE